MRAAKLNGTLSRTLRIGLRVSVVGGLALGLALVGASAASAATDPGLGSAGSFAVLAYSTVTNTGPSVISGDIGLSPGTAVEGFPPGTQIAGAAYTAEAVALGARADTSTAYTNAANQAGPTPVLVELGGTTLNPGLYSSGGVLQITGDLTLDALGDPNAIFVFQSASTLTTISGSHVILTGQANPCNIFWVVPSSAQLGTNSTFAGTVMASDSIAAQTGATIIGRLLALNGAVTLDTNTITSTGCSPITVNPGSGITVQSASAATAAARARGAGLVTPAALTGTALAPTGVAPLPALLGGAFAVLAGLALVSRRLLLDARVRRTMTH